MKSHNTALGAVISIIGGVYANKDVVTLNTNGNAWIREASATLVLPELPNPVTGDVALWSAIMMDDFNGDFLQGVTQSSPAYQISLRAGLLVLTLFTAPWVTAASKATGATSRIR